MHPTFTRLPSGLAAGAALAVVLFTVTSCSAGTGTADSAAALAVSSAPSTHPSARVVLQFGDHAVRVDLEDSVASRELADRMPLRLQVSDSWAQAKSARLSQPLTVDDTRRTLTPRPGGVYYWPDTAALAIYYDDLGQNVPPPGLVQLGIVETGLDEIADAGGLVTARVELANQSR
jgi:hypothetical protein